MTVRILAVCGCGQGSSMIMKMKIGQFLTQEGVAHTMNSCAVGEYKSELSGADIQMSFIGEIARAQGKLQAYPNLAAWVEKFQARPAYRKAVEQGGEYAFAK